MIKKAALAMVALPMLMTHAADAKVALPVKYDNVYGESTYYSHMGYHVGDTRYTGEQIKAVALNTGRFDMRAAASLPDVTLYSRAKNPGNINTADVRMNGGYYRLALRPNRTIADGFNSGVLFSQRKYNDEMVKLVNAERRKAGLAPVAYSTSLFKGSMTRTSEMAAYGSARYNGVAHMRPNGTQYYTAFNDVHGYGTLGENMLSTSHTGNPYALLSERYMAERTFKQWNDSEGHRRNMLDPRYRWMSVSIQTAKSRESLYYDGIYAEMALHSDNGLIK